MSGTAHDGISGRVLFIGCNWGRSHRSRHALNADTIREMHAAFRRGGRKAIEKVMRNQPAVFLKLLVLLVPRSVTSRWMVCTTQRYSPTLKLPAKGRIGSAGAKIVSRIARVLPWAVVAAGMAGSPAWTQANLDAGKSAEQIFSNACNACHRSPREIKPTSAAFLREHYTYGCAGSGGYGRLSRLRRQ